MSKPERQKRKYTRRQPEILESLPESKSAVTEILEIMAELPDPDQPIIITAAGTTPEWVDDARKVQSEPPEKDPQHGDKTPEFIEWYRANHTSEEFEANYGGRKHHLSQ